MGTGINQAMLSMPGALRREPARFVLADVSAMRKSEVIEFHEREAARLRQLLANATTPALRARLAEQAKERPNILVLMTDDHGQWASHCYGNRELSTPNMDLLAETGALMQSQPVPWVVEAYSAHIIFNGVAHVDIASEYQSLVDAALHLWEGWRRGPREP